MKWSSSISACSGIYAMILPFPSGKDHLMHTGRIVFAQIIDFLPTHAFRKCVRRYGRSRVVDPMRRIRADTGHFPGVALATVDLDQTYPTWYKDEMLKAYPTMRKTINSTRRPELYNRLIEPHV